MLNADVIGQVMARQLRQKGAKFATSLDILGNSAADSVSMDITAKLIPRETRRRAQGMFVRNLWSGRKN